MRGRGVCVCVCVCVCVWVDPKVILEWDGGGEGFLKGKEKWVIWYLNASKVQKLINKGNSIIRTQIMESMVFTKSRKINTKWKTRPNAFIWHIIFNHKIYSKMLSLCFFYQFLHHTKWWMAYFFGISSFYFI